MEDNEIEHTQEHVISVSEWMIVLLISFIPVINIVMYFVWGFGDNTNPNKANWAKAYLIWTAIVIGLWILFFIIVLTFQITFIQESGINI